MKSLSGQLLIAGHDLLDPNFYRSVVLLIQHTDDGAMGVILNRPTETSIGDAWDQVFHTQCECDGVLHQGGPCDGPLMVVHDKPAVSQVKVAPGVHFSTDKDHITWLVEHHADPVKFFVGYAGWGPGQLESELAAESWLVTPALADHVFTTDRRQWDDLTKRIERTALFDKLRIRHVPDDPSVN